MKANGIYWNGDRAILTGESEFKHGAYFHEYKLVEGHKKDQTIWSERLPNYVIGITKDGSIKEELAA